MLDRTQYPLTNQPEISDCDQSLIDAINLDELHEAIDLGNALSDREKACLLELEAKNAIRMQGRAEESPPETLPVEPQPPQRSEWYLGPEAAARVEAGHRAMVAAIEKDERKQHAKKTDPPPTP